MSVNQAFQGRRFKTPAYKAYESELLLKLKPLELPEPPYEVTYEWGFSSAGSDIGNPEKLFTDILSKKYGFNDNQIYEMHLHKVKVKKGAEYITFQITEYVKE
jgi:Holliday junction resolvase RusA-like endonuclease